MKNKIQDSKVGIARDEATLKQRKRRKPSVYFIVTFTVKSMAPRLEVLAKADGSDNCRTTQTRNNGLTRLYKLETEDERGK